MLDYGEALDNYLEAYTIAIKDLEPFHEMIVLNNIAILYSKDKKYDKAEEYFSKALELAKNNKDLIKQGLYSINLAKSTGSIRIDLGTAKDNLSAQSLYEKIGFIQDTGYFSYSLAIK